VGGGGANFCDVSGEDGCREGHIRWIGRIGRSGDAVGCGENAAGDWGGLVGSKHQFVMDGCVVGCKVVILL
jgi:hypothetical protein